MMKFRDTRGDTLIEVLLAMAILTVMIVGAIGVMNFGAANNQTAVEHSQVRSAINGQTAMLQYLRDDYMVQFGQPLAGSAGAEWATIIGPSYLNTGAMPAIDDASCAPINAAKAFYLDGNALNPAGTVTKYTGALPATYAQPGQGLWVEAFRVVGTNPSEAAVDFLIRGCWSATYNAPLQQETTITRLYDGK